MGALGFATPVVSYGPRGILTLFVLGIFVRRLVVGWYVLKGVARKGHLGERATGDAAVVGVRGVQGVSVWAGELLKQGGSVRESGS